MQDFEQDFQQWESAYNKIIKEKEEARQALKKEVELLHIIANTTLFNHILSFSFREIFLKKLFVAERFFLAHPVDAEVIEGSLIFNLAHYTAGRRFVIPPEEPCCIFVTEDTKLQVKLSPLDPFQKNINQ